MSSITSVSSKPAARYGAMAIGLHWLMGLLLLGLFALGVYMSDLPFTPQRLKLYNWHKWTGVVVLVLALWRLCWRLASPPPALSTRVAAAMPRWQRRAHQATHRALYLLFLAVPVLGWAYSSAAGFPVVLFGALPLPDLVGADKVLAATLKPWHKFSAFAMAALVLLHVAAVLKHHFIDRDDLIKRMWPGQSTDDRTGGGS